MRRAFSLIELLVVIAIISLLVSLLLPALAGTRRTAKVTIGFANLRSLSQVMATYLGENHEEFLNPFRPSWPATSDYSGMTWTMIHALNDPQQRWDFNTPMCPPATTEGFANVWYSYLAEYRSGTRTDPEQLSPADGELLTQYHDSLSDDSVRQGKVLMPTSYYYPPVFWSKASRFASACRDEMKPEYVSTALLAAVTYPSAKVMLFERCDFGSGRSPIAWFGNTAKTHVALVDGSCDTINMSQLITAAAQSNSADLIPTQPCCHPPEPMIFFWATLNGIHGRDLPR